MSFLRRAAAPALIVAAAAALAWAPSSLEAARRHVHLEKSSPAEGETVVAPKSVSLWFSEKVDLKMTNVKVADAKGAAAAIGALKRDTATKAPVTADFTTPLAPGAYTLNWSVAGADGHPQKGTVKFSVKAAH